MAWEKALRGYAQWQTAAGQAVSTRRLRCGYIRRLAAEVGDSPWEVRPEQLIAFLAMESWAPETRKSARASIRSFYGWALESGYVGTDPSTRLPRVRIPLTIPRPVPDPLVNEVLARADDRDRLMVTLAAFVGLRRSEIATLRTEDMVGDMLLIKGKGGRERYIPLMDPLLHVLRQQPAGYLFPGRIDGHISADRVGHILRRLLGKGWSGHKLRHRFASAAYSGNQDLLAVQRLLGHAKPETTRRYVFVPDSSLRAAVAAAGRLVA